MLFLSSEKHDNNICFVQVIIAVFILPVRERPVTKTWYKVDQKVAAGQR